MLRTNVFSPLTSRDKCVTDQHRHEHCTETPPTGIPHREHILTSATHSALHYVVGNKTHPPGYFLLSSPCRVILPPPSQYIYIYIYICVCVYIYVCICMRERERERLYKRTKTFKLEQSKQKKSRLCQLQH